MWADNQCPFNFSHITRRHTSQGFKDFSSSVTFKTDNLESNEEQWSEDTGDPIPNQQSNVTYITVPLTPSIPERSLYRACKLYKARVQTCIIDPDNFTHFKKCNSGDIKLDGWYCFVVCSKTIDQGYFRRIRKPHWMIHHTITQRSLLNWSAEVLKTNLNRL